MKSSFSKGAKVGVLGLATALALGGVVVTTASANDESTAPASEGSEFNHLATELFADPSVSGVT